MTPSEAGGPGGARTPEWIDGVVLCALVAAGSRAVEANRDRINALNVFPVPDGDTGTNMSLTLKAVVEQSAVQPAIHAGEAARRMARCALLAARGNSGLISAQLFRGIADAAAGRERMSPAEFAAGLRAGAGAAYDSVPDPREGTMLTVMRVTAETASECAAAGAGVAALLEAVVAASAEAVALTPTQLDVLRDAGVVDAGGYGLFVFLSGALEQARGRGDGTSDFPPPAPVGVEGDGRTAAGVRVGFVETAQETVYGYCTVFMIEGEDLDVAGIRQSVATLGESAVVAGDAGTVKVHLHPLDPGPVLSYGAGLGTLSGITILNMDEQTAEWAASQGVTPAERAVTEPERLDVALVAVCAGEGLAGVFAQAGMGACSVLEGGDTMNPSVQELLDAVEAAHSDRVLLLPNNKNIVAAAMQVPALTEKEVRVVGTTSVQAGIAAAFAFSPSAGIDANLAAMDSAAAAVRSGWVTSAVRDAVVSDRAIRAGEVMALLDGHLIATADEPVKALVELVRHAGPASELVTVYAGADTGGAEPGPIRDAIRQVAGDAEVEFVHGGQPHHHFLVAFE